MKRRGLYITFLITNVALISAAIIFGLATKSSFSTETKNEYYQSLPVVQRSASIDLLTVDGQGSNFSLPAEFESESTDIIVGSFIGERSYGYQAFISTVHVDKVFKGNISKGENIQIYEPLQIIPVSRINYDLNVQSKEIRAQLSTSRAKIVRQSPISSYFYGKNAMQNGATYLFFLQKKWTNPYKQSDKIPTYRMLQNAYSRINISNSSSVIVLPDPEVTTLLTSEQADQTVTDTESLSEYNTISYEILNNYGY